MLMPSKYFYFFLHQNYHWAFQEKNFPSPVELKRKKQIDSLLLLTLNGVNAFAPGVSEPGLAQIRLVQNDINF